MATNESANEPTKGPETPLVGRYVPGIPRLNIARALRNDVEAAGGIVPRRLINLIESDDVLKTPPPAIDPAEAMMNAATSGELTAAKLGELIVAAVGDKAMNEYRELLRNRGSVMLAQRFAEELSAGAADEIIDSFRERFTAAAEVIEAGVSTIANLGQSHEEFLRTAEPAQVLAYQNLGSAADTVEEIITVVTRYFGLRSPDAYGVLTRPNISGAGADGSVTPLYSQLRQGRCSRRVTRVIFSSQKGCGLVAGCVRGCA